MHRKILKLTTIILFSLLSFQAQSQKNTPKKYPSLFWEITGNGLKKPSYLFGTMHVSSKMVFHLSDSFYYAIKNVETVALELNPDLWQGQMVKMDLMKQNYADFASSGGGQYINENSSRINKYDDELKAALSSEPTVVNSLLYRTYKAKEDFEEDTFLDLYIYQTGKKLGKKATGVEDFYETEKVIIEAYTDMANEKKKKTVDTDGESMRDIQEKIQDAYRRGDLDLMDSLDLLTDRSDAFRAKFLYKRNDIQANSIDTILKKGSLFVGVGAAHLPGDKGIIEILRRKGYKLRPIKMLNRDAAQKEATDDLKVPVIFSQQESDDGFYKVATPGPLFKLTEEYQNLDRRQYSDMSNGCYYLVTRVKTHAAFLGQSEDAVLKKIDSLLYENIPGKILKRTPIKKNGYTGYDITNKTRRGDLQRYNIFITPFEILVFKISGKENYIDGKEGAEFFSSIQLREAPNTSLVFTPKQGGFSVKLPQKPFESQDNVGNGGTDRWEYEATDKSGNAYMILKKSLYNFAFLDEDTFDLKLVEESFRSPDYFDKQIERKQSSYNGYPCLDVKEKMKDSSIINARYIIKGPHYYVIAARVKDNKKLSDDFLNSFSFTPYQYGSANNYVDTFIHFTVFSPVIPDLDTAYRALIEKTAAEMANSVSYSNYNNYWPRAKVALFKNDSTGERITVRAQEYPKYFYVKDSLKFWKNEMDDYYDNSDLVLFKTDTLKAGNEIKGFHFILRDTGSSRTIERRIILKDNYMFSIATQGDTLNHQSSFISSFFNSFAPQQQSLGRNIFINTLDSFFTNLFSTDSTTHSRAQKAINSVYYGESGIPKILDAINRLKPSDKDYFDTKSKLIIELGDIKDSTTHSVVKHLKKIYEQTADTSIFQNEVIRALVRHRTTEATALFKELILQDPPVFDNSYEYNDLVSQLQDSLKLAKDVFPDLLQLTTLSDYKEPVISLLVTLVDSGYIKTNKYEDYFSKIYFDAKIELKKQQGKDEKKMEQENKKDDDDEDIEYARAYDYSSSNSALNDYALLLIPFYDKNVNVPKYFDKLLSSKDEDVQLNTAILLLKNKKPVADSLLLSFASKDKLRGRLYTQLEDIKRLDKYPTQYKNQGDLARSYLVEDKSYNKIDSIIFVSKQPASYDNKKGVVYLYKYRIKKTDDWKMGFSGLQPENATELSSDDKLVLMTDRKIKNDTPENEQFEEQLKRLLYTFHKSARYFFEGSGYNYQYRKAGEYGE